MMNIYLINNRQLILLNQQIKNKKIMKLYLSILIVVLTFAFIIICQNTQLIRLSYKLKELLAQKQKEEILHQKLLAEYATLNRFEQIKEIATKRLNMCMPKEVEVIYLPEEEYLFYYLAAGEGRKRYPIYSEDKVAAKKKLFAKNKIKDQKDEIRAIIGKYPYRNRIY